MDGGWILSRVFFLHLFMRPFIVYFSFGLFIWWITLIVFEYYRQTCLPEINSTWLRCIVLSVLQDLICWFFKKEFCIYVDEGYWSIVSTKFWLISGHPNKLILTFFFFQLKKLLLWSNRILEFPTPSVLLISLAIFSLQVKCRDLTANISPFIFYFYIIVVLYAISSKW